MIRIEPVGEMVLVKPNDKGDIEEAPSGLLVVRQNYSTPQTNDGVVIAVGSGELNKRTLERVPLEVREGDRIVFVRYAGHSVTLDGEEFVLLREAEILAKKVT